MKERPTPKPKLRYLVTLDGQEFLTSAFNPQGAISNAAFRLSSGAKMGIALTMHKIKLGEIIAKVEEVSNGQEEKRPD